ncbi:class I SAM-dependent methyltransferase [Gracilimonas mengyeensis]|uniref:Methyltransferase domain-containing protein n=1 Tax=Gracilimonas mengyeensis TaxID=1302730 RepID=A0A521FM69_9BACT|nr:methyltransferase domain-containing protein [Gracilimonas mengyeensis]SMO97184.1 Methyltransferase domain-containing protein [Gracilimonas mengyeensis]
MTEAEAISFIEGVDIEGEEPQSWVDLGCGKCLFSYALAAYLPDGSSILAVDKKNQVPIKPSIKKVELTFHKADFLKEKLPIADFDGVLMANSLHYVKDKKVFLHKLKEETSENGKLIIVEYDTTLRNPWIPHPIPFDDLKELLKEIGYDHINKIGERASKYGHKNMYACVVQ